MQTNARRYFEERNVIAANPLLPTLRMARFIWFFISACMVALIVVVILLVAIFGGGEHFAARPILSFIPLLLLNIFNLVMNIPQVGYWEGIERRRFAAVQGDRTLLAAEQPNPYAAPVQLPLTITLRYRKEFMLWMVGGIILFALIFSGAFTLDNTTYLIFTSSPYLFFLATFSIFTVLMLVILLIVFFSGLGRQQIEVTERGITARYSGKTGTMMWEEARLFAVYPTYGARKSGASITYELSSARDIVRWMWVLRKTHFSSVEPTIPPDEYNRQMQALLSLVKAKTGLALYDFR